MSEKGLPVFDETLHLTHEWMNGVRESIGADAQQQYHALRSVLFAVRDRLTIEEAFDLSSQLPMLVRGFFWADFFYVRLHGPKQQAYEGHYDGRTLAGWAQKFLNWSDEGKKVYCYFDNDQKSCAPLDAQKLMESLKKQS